MSVEISFPLEFLVFGTPVSGQTQNPRSKLEWKARVREASCEALPEGHFAAAGPVTMTLFYFPKAEMQGDVDNIVKPILDALTKHIYYDDKQVERVWVQKFEPDRAPAFSAPSATLRRALYAERPVTYVRVMDDPMEGLL